MRLWGVVAAVKSAETGDTSVDVAVNSAETGDTSVDVGWVLGFV